jgi:flagellar hook-basal body complex protein FliE
MTGFDLPPIDPRVRLLGEAVQDPRRAGGDGPAAPGQPDGDGFAGVLADSLARVQALQDDARAKARGLALGEDVDLHDVMIAAGKSEVAFNLMLEVRNKLVEAWEKLSRSVM